MLGAEWVGAAMTATAGAAAIATANPPARSSRRAGSFKVGIITLSVVLLIFVARSCGGRVDLLAETLRCTCTKRRVKWDKSGA
jgi:hypothetical protein